MRISLNTSSVGTFDEWLAYYNRKFREKGTASSLPQTKFYAFSALGRFNKNFADIWDFFKQNPQINVQEYTDIVFDVGSTTDECMPHRFLGARYKRMYEFNQEQKKVKIKTKS